ncbi:MAG: Gfo/Idh/MocA family oxidoreductase [Anaerolineales bacterium]|nr:Gfo/Idh/MocA family oxidoreductase [Anaerolineales bacterium]
MKPPIRIGLIGCGRLAQQVHLPLLQHLPDFQLTALAESDPARRAEAARRAPPARAFESAEALLASGLAEAVLISTPSHLHAAPAEAALRAGLHVYLEKPIASTLDDGRRLVAAGRASGRVALVGFNYRFHPLYAALRQVTQSGALGALTTLTTQFTTPPRELPVWKRARVTGGGVLLDLASHHIDLVRWLTGQEVAAASAVLRSVHTQDDNAEVVLRLTGGAVARSEFSFTTRDVDRVLVTGAAGVAGVDRYRSWLVERAPVAEGAARWWQLARAGPALLGSPVLRHKLSRSRAEPSYAAALAHFAAAVRGEVAAAPSLEDGLRALEVISAAEASAQAGAPVSVTPSAALPLLGAAEQGGPGRPSPEQDSWKANR